jgi:hypothetical protein
MQTPQETIIGLAVIASETKIALDRQERVNQELAAGFAELTRERDALLAERNELLLAQSDGAGTKEAS